jgi:hypothetical protein
MVYVIEVCRQLSSRIRMELQSHPDPVRKLYVWEYIPGRAHTIAALQSQKIHHHL